MSSNATALAWASEATTTEKIVLLALAAYADDQDVTPADRETLALMTATHESTIGRVLRDLEAKGKIVKAEPIIRNNPDGSPRIVQRYRLRTQA